MSPETRAELAYQRDHARGAAKELHREATDLATRAEGKTRQAQDLRAYAADLDVILGDVVSVDVVLGDAS